MTPRLLRWGMNLWPPYLGAGIHVRASADAPARQPLQLPEERVAAIRADVAAGAKVLPEFEVEIRDRAGELVASVHKTLYVRLKPRYRPT